MPADRMGPAPEADGEADGGGGGGARLAPLHALLSGLPLGLFVGASALDLASRLASEPYTFPRAAYWLLVLAVLSAVVAGGPGLVVLRGLPATSARARRGRRHVYWTDGGILLAIASLVVRRGSNYAAAVGVGALLLALAATVATFVGAWAAVVSRLDGDSS